MKQTLPELIRQNEALRQTLLVQEGGIVKYLAEHLDADGTAVLFSDYQNQCADNFFERNKWDPNKVWSGDEMRRAALGYEHLFREVQCQAALKPVLAELPADVAEKIEDFNEQYLSWAYKKNRQRYFPNGMTPREFYHEIIEMYRNDGLAFKCLRILLQEHSADGEIEKSASELYAKFQILQYINNLVLNDFAQMRQAVAEMLNGKTDEQCIRMAVDTMRHVRGFSQMIYTDAAVEHLRLINFDDLADKREREGQWLRETAKNAVSDEVFSKGKHHSMRYCFAMYVNLLSEIGRIWAAQLLVRKYDMRKLEKEVVCIMNPNEDSYYYVDKYYFDDLPDLYCIYDVEQAETLLEEIKNISENSSEKKGNQKVSDEDLSEENGIKGKVTDIKHVMKQIDPEVSWDESMDTIFNDKVKPRVIFNALKDAVPDTKLNGRPQHYVSYRILKILKYIKEETTAKDYLKWINLHFNCGWSDKKLKFRINNKVEFDNKEPSEWLNVHTDSKIEKLYYAYAIKLKNTFTVTMEDGMTKQSSSSFECLKDRIAFLNTVVDDDGIAFENDDIYVNNGK